MLPAVPWSSLRSVRSSSIRCQRCTATVPRLPPRDAAPLLLRLKGLIGKRWRRRASDRNEGEIVALMAGIAGPGQAVEGARELAAVVVGNRLVEIGKIRVADGVDHLRQGNIVERRIVLCDGFEPLAQLLHLIVRQRPIVHLPGKPKLGVAQLLKHHDLADLGLERLWRSLCGWGGLRR